MQLRIQMRLRLRFQMRIQMHIQLRIRIRSRLRETLREAEGSRGKTLVARAGLPLPPRTTRMVYPVAPDGRFPLGLAGGRILPVDVNELSLPNTPGIEFPTQAATFQLYRSGLTTVTSITTTKLNSRGGILRQLPHAALAKSRARGETKISQRLPGRMSPGEWPATGPLSSREHANSPHDCRAALL